MNDPISDYQKWKQQGADLRVQAKQAMEARFRALLTEAVHIAEEYRSDFGLQLKPPAPVSAFRYKSPTKTKAKGKQKAAVKIAEPEAAPPKPNPKIEKMQKRLATAKKKLEDAKAAGTSTRALEDKIYEIEDEIRLESKAGSA